MNKKILVLIALALTISSTPTSVDATSTASQTVCTVLTHPLSLGSTNSNTGGDVSRLQNFLSTQNLFASTNISGYFGIITRASVQLFQSQQGIEMTGTVGPLTRDAIRRMSCGSTNQAPTITSIGPSSGHAGRVIVLQGTGFVPSTLTAMNNRVRFASLTGSGSLTYAEMNGATSANVLYFFTPSIALGEYNVTVENSNGVSAPQRFTVISKPTVNNTQQVSVTATTSSTQTINSIISSLASTTPTLTTSNIQTSTQINTSGTQTTAVTQSASSNTSTNQAPTITSIGPSSGHAGRVIVLQGTGFVPSTLTAMNNRVRFASLTGSGSLTYAEMNGATSANVLYFFTPSIALGEYNVTVENSNGVSAPQRFTVISKH